MRSKLYENFIVWLEEQLEKLPEGHKLPPIRDICAKFRLSHTTIARILRDFYSRNAIYRIPGKGLFTGSPPEKVPDRQPNGLLVSSAERLAGDIEKDIFTGKFKTGAVLPSVKFQSSNYGVSSLTVTKAYGILRRRQRIAKVGRFFRVGAIPVVQDQIRHQVYYFAFSGKSVPAPYVNSSNGEAVVRALEAELRSFNTAICFERPERFAQMVTQWIRTQDFPRGLVFDTIDKHTLNLIRTDLLRLMNAAPMRAPRVLFLSRFMEHQLGKGVETFALGGTETVMLRIIAEYIHQHEFRNVVLFFDHRNNTSHDLSIFLRFWPQMKKINPLIPVRFYVAASDMPGPGTSATAWIAKQRDEQWITKIHSKFSEDYPEFSFEALDADIRFVDSFGESIGLLPPKTICVFHDYRNAVQGLEKLRALKRKIPNDIAVIGMGNSFEYIRSGISSSSIGWEKIGYLCAHAILRDFPLLHTTHGFIRISGTLFRRLTTP